MTRLHLLLLSVALAACHEAPPPALVPEVQPGPAAGAHPGRVLVLAATCGSVEYHCPSDFARTAGTIVKSGLEFAGYTVIDSDGVRLEPRQRHEEHTTVTATSESHDETRTEGNILPVGEHTTSSGVTHDETDTDKIVLDGPGFEDLTVDQRREALARAGADAVLSIRIVVGGTTGVWRPNQNVEVMIKLGVNQGDTMAWASRCVASSNDFTTVTAALEHATRCAVHGATAR